MMSGSGVYRLPLGAVVDYVFDFSGFVPEGDTITAAELAVPSPVYEVDDLSFADGKVTGWFGCEEGGVFVVVCTITTLKGRKVSKSLVLQYDSVAGEDGIPVLLSRASLGGYIEGQLGPVAASLGWNAGDGDFDEIINDALLQMGQSRLSSIIGAEPIRAMRKCALLFAWERVASWVAGDHDFSGDGISLKRSQVYEQAKQQIVELERQLSGYLPGTTVQVREFKCCDDPYARSLEERIHAGTE